MTVVQSRFVYAVFSESFRVIPVLLASLSLSAWHSLCASRLRGPLRKEGAGSVGLSAWVCDCDLVVVRVVHGVAIAFRSYSRAVHQLLFLTQYHPGRILEACWGVQSVGTIHEVGLIRSDRELVVVSSFVIPAHAFTSF